MNHSQRILEFFITVSTLEKQMNRLRAAHMAKAGLNGADLLPLIVLYNNPQGLQPDEIIRMTSTDKAQVSRSLRHLREKEMIEKENGSHYRAKYSLSEKGKELMEPLAQKCVEIFEQAHLGHDEEEWEVFYSFCRGMSCQIDEMVSQSKDSSSAHSNSQMDSDAKKKGENR